MNLTTFDDLLQAARGQSTAQRLLLVFTRAELPADATPEQAQAFAQGQGGALVPRACVDKSTAELASFEALAEEAGAMGLEWDMVFASTMHDPGTGAQADAAVTAALDRLVESIKLGQIGQCVVFNRSGAAVRLG